MIICLPALPTDRFVTLTNVVMYKWLTSMNCDYSWVDIRTIDIRVDAYAEKFKQKFDL